MFTVEKELISFCFEINNNDTSFYSKALHEHYGKAKIIDFLEIKSSKKEINCRHTGRISIANPAYDYFQSQTADASTNWQSEEVSKAAVAYLGIDLKQVERVKIIQNNGYKLCLVVRNVDWKSLSTNQLKFAYLYLSLIKETDLRINNLNSQLRIFNTSEQVMYWVSEMQIALLNEAIDLLKKQGSEIPQNVRFIKQEYNQLDFEALTLYFLNDLIINLKRKYGHHFTEEVNQYLRSYNISAEEVKSRIKGLNNELQSLEDDGLKEIINTQIELLLSFYEGKYVSLHDYTYSKTLLIEISSLFSKSTEQKVEIEQIENLLITFNFNQTDFIDWKTKHLRIEMMKQKNQYDLRKYLLLEQKKIKQLVANTGIAYRKKFPSASDLVITWIKEELTYLDGLNFSNPEEISYSVSQESASQKITTTLNVPQLALFAALMVEEDLIQDKNKTQVFSTFAKVFKTVNQPNIAVTSLRNNYYDKDPKNLEALKTKLIQMINRLNLNLNSNEAF